MIAKALLLFLSIQTVALANQNRFPNNYVDDIYHCQNPWAVDKKVSIGCDQDTFLWNVDELQEERPPFLCGGGQDFTVNPDEANEFPDLLEPCLLWAMSYGNLAPTAAPTVSPTKLVPPSKLVPLGYNTVGWIHML